MMGDKGVGPAERAAGFGCGNAIRADREAGYGREGGDDQEAQAPEEGLDTSVVEEGTEPSRETGV